MIKQPEVDRTELIRDTLNSITHKQMQYLSNARSEADIDAAYNWATDATAELQCYFTSDIEDLQRIARKYKNND